MDNNFNSQQSNMGQPMGQPMQQPMYQQPMGQPMQQPMYQQQMGQPMQQQPMYQQPMYQPMYNPMYPQPKKNTGLIIGIISAISVLVIAAVVIVLVLVLGGGKNKLIGTWQSEDGYTLTFEKGNTGSMSESGFSLPITWKLDGDKLTITVSYMGESETLKVTVDKLTSKKLILKNEDGDTVTLNKVK